MINAQGFTSQYGWLVIYRRNAFVACTADSWWSVPGTLDIDR